MCCTARPPLALLVALLVTLAGCDDGADAQPPAWQGEVTLAPIDGWAPLTADDDPFADRPAEVECPDYGAQTEDGIFEVETDVCRYGSFAQPLPVALRPGDVVEATVWHLQLWAPERAQGHVALQLGDRLLWEERPTIPGNEAVYLVEVPVEQDWPAGTPLVFHVHNHGANSWRVLDVTARRP